MRKMLICCMALFLFGCSSKVEREEFKEDEVVCYKYRVIGISCVRMKDSIELDIRE